MKRGHSIFTIILFAALLMGGCEKLVVPEHGGSATEETGTNNGNNSGKGDGEKGDENASDTPSPSPDNGDNDDNTTETGNKNPDETGGDAPDEGGGDAKPEILHDGNEASPYLVSDLATGNVGRYIIEKGASISGSWIVGYIVGYINGTKLTSKNAIFAAGDKETNILIADSPTETDYALCVPVQLSSGSSYKEARAALNLKNNPDNIGKKVKLMGVAEKYMGCAGIKNTRKYKFIK